MDYTIDDLKQKVKQLKSEPSQQLLREIEGLLRDIRSSESIPYYLHGSLVDALVQLRDACPTGGNGNIPFLVSDIIDKLIGRDTKATAGSTAAEGQNIVRRDSNDPLSASKILSKLNFRLWP